MTEDQTELRERRRAKILASKEARMARITGAQKGGSKESIQVDEVVLQEFIAEGKKQAVELAKEDYALTHEEHETEPDELLSAEQVKKRKAAQLEEKLQKIRENSPASKIEMFLSNLVVLVAAISAAIFMFKRVQNDFKFCLNLSKGIRFDKISTCRQNLLPSFLQTVPGTFVVALLPLLSDFFKGRKSFPQIVFSILPRTILFFVTFIVTIQLLLSLNN